MTKQRVKASLAGLALFLIAATLTAQVTEEWVARYDGPINSWDEANAIAIDGAGNVYVTGSSHGSGTYLDYATVKYDSSGVEQWVTRYDGPGDFFDIDVANAIAIDGAGNVYVTGSSTGSGEYNYDYATIKYNSSGTEQWVARYDGPASGSDAANAMAVDGAGNVYVTGSSTGSGTYADYATVKYSSSGVEEWVARYDGPVSGRDEANAIAIDGAGNVYVTGYSIGSGTYIDYLTVKYNSSGAEQWVARYVSQESYEDEAHAMAIDADGNVYVTGTSCSSGTYDDYATVKYDSSGVQQWVARYDGPASGIDAANALALDGAGTAYVTGSSEGSGTERDYATVKYDSSGVEQWVARYNGPVGLDGANAIAIDGAGNAYVTGSIEGSGTSLDYATIKYSSSGLEEWVARYDATSSTDGANAIAIDDAGNVYVTGSSEGSETLDDYATIKYSQGPGVAEASSDVSGHRLEVAQLTPQPTISYTLPVSTHVSLKVYDVTGRLVRTLVFGSQEAGIHTVTWDATDYPAGLYFVRLESGKYSVSAKLIVR